MIIAIQFIQLLLAYLTYSAKISRIYFIKNPFNPQCTEKVVAIIYTLESARIATIFFLHGLRMGRLENLALSYVEDLSLFLSATLQRVSSRSKNERALCLHNLKSDPHNYLQMPYRYWCGADINFRWALSVSASYNPITSLSLVIL